MAEFVLNKGHIDFVPIVAEEHKDLAVKYGVSLTPTLIVAHDNTYDVYENASNVKKFAEHSKM